MKKITCAVVEDDAISLAMVQAMAERTGLLDIKASFKAPDLAIPWLAENEVELLFLDVEMPGMSGIELLTSLANKPDAIIISGNPNYAVDAFDLAVVDYLVKPLKDFPRFLEAVNKVIAKRRRNPDFATEKSLFVKVDSQLLKLNVESILWIEAFGDYIKIVTADKTHTVYATLKKIQEKLEKSRFVRVHRSYIVNISKITNIDPTNLEINKTVIPISGTHKEELLNRISIL